MSIQSSIPQEPEPGGQAGEATLWANHDRGLFDRYLPAPSGSQRCPVSGFGRSTFYREVIQGAGRDHVRVFDLRKPGQVRARKYYHAGDLLRWLDCVAEEHTKRERPPNMHQSFPKTVIAQGPEHEVSTN